MRATNLLDLGCGDGSFSREIGKVVGATRIVGVDVETPHSKYIEFLKFDLNNKGIPLPDNSFDLIIAIEVIEHLMYPDNMLREAWRLLKPGGYFVISTPNLASIINRMLILIGYMPYFSEPSLEYNAGLLTRKKMVDKPAGHLRLYTLKAIKELLYFHGFKIRICRGSPAGFSNRFLCIVEKLFNSFPSLYNNSCDSSKALK
jgi:SAM-dependent methyltransferase